MKARNNIKQFDCRKEKLVARSSQLKPGQGQESGVCGWMQVVRFPAPDVRKMQTIYVQGPIFAKCGLFVPARVEVPDRIQTLVINGVQGVDDAVLEKDIGHGFPLIKQIH